MNIRGSNIHILEQQIDYYETKLQFLLQYIVVLV